MKRKKNTINKTSQAKSMTRWLKTKSIIVYNEYELYEHNMMMITDNRNENSTINLIFFYFIIESLDFYFVWNFFFCSISWAYCFHVHGIWSDLSKWNKISQNNFKSSFWFVWASSLIGKKKCQGFFSFVHIHIMNPIEILKLIVNNFTTNIKNI